MRFILAFVITLGMGTSMAQAADRFPIIPPDQMNAEQMLGRGIRVEQSPRAVDRHDAASDVFQNVLCLVPRLLEGGNEEILPFTALAEAHAEESDRERDESDDDDLHPNRRLDACR